MYKARQAYNIGSETMGRDILKHMWPTYYYSEDDVNKRTKIPSMRGKHVRLVTKKDSKGYDKQYEKHKQYYDIYELERDTGSGVTTADFASVQDVFGADRYTSPNMEEQIANALRIKHGDQISVISKGHNLGQTHD